MAISLSIIVPAADQPDVIRPRYNFGGRRFQRIIDFHVRDLNKMVASFANEARSTWTLRST